MSVWRTILQHVLPSQYSQRAISERRSEAKRCICPSNASNSGDCPIHDRKGRVRAAVDNDYVLRVVAQRDTLRLRLNDAAIVIESMANGADRQACSPQLDRVIACLRVWPPAPQGRSD